MSAVNGASAFKVNFSNSEEQAQIDNEIVLWAEVYSFQPRLELIRECIASGTNPFAVALFEGTEAQDPTEKGDTIPHVLVKLNQIAVMQLFLELRADTLACTNGKGQTVLELIEERGSAAMKQLIGQ